MRYHKLSNPQNFFCSLTLAASLILFSPYSALSQKRPDGLKLRSAEIDAALNAAEILESEEPPTVNTRRRRLTGRRISKRSKRLRKMLGRKGRKFSREYPSIDGSNNNLQHATWGKAFTPFKRLAQATYADGISAMNDSELPSPREISNLCFDQSDDNPNHYSATDFLWQWGQFLDHDITLTPVLEPAETAKIAIPSGDMFFDPFATGAKEMGFSRSAHVLVGGVRQQMNAITAFVDASQVYGSDRHRQLELRTLDGTGRLKESAGRLLPFNTNLIENDNPGDDLDPTFFLAGDIRANEQVGLTTMHVLFVREHNFWADYLAQAFPRADGERIYQMARGIVAGEMQAITYNEYLPFLLGQDAIPPYQGYDRNVDPSISNEFATAAYRVGHTMLSSFIPRLNANQQIVAEGHLLLRDAFFKPERLINEGGIEPVLRGLASRRSQSIDNKLVDDIRNFLFGPPGAGGFDLASLNIQRGRDHGLPSYNDVRRAMGLTPASSFSDITSNPEVASGLSSVYNSIEDVELWVGGLHEDHVDGAMVGETFRAILLDQFVRLRDGDRFWYERHLPGRLRNMVSKQTLSKVIRRNTSIKKQEIQANVFKLRAITPP